VKQKQLRINIEEKKKSKSKKNELRSKGTTQEIICHPKYHARDNPEEESCVGLAMASSFRLSVFSDLLKATMSSSDAAWLPSIPYWLLLRTSMSNITWVLKIFLCCVTFVSRDVVRKCDGCPRDPLLLEPWFAKIF